MHCFTQQVMFLRTNAPSVVQVICPRFSGKLVRYDEIASAASEDIFPLSGIKAWLRSPDAAANCGSALTMGIADYAEPYKILNRHQSL